MQKTLSSRTDARITLPSSKERALADLIEKSLQVAQNATTKGTYYATNEEMQKAMGEAIKNMRNFSVELPLILANVRGATGSFIQNVLVHELKNSIFSRKSRHSNVITSADYWENISDSALYATLDKLRQIGTPYVMRFLVMLKDNKVNNKRTKKLILNTIFQNGNIDFEVGSGKYRSKTRKALEHAWGKSVKRDIINLCAQNLSRRIDSVVDSGDTLEKNLFRFSDGNLTRNDAMRMVLFIFGKSDEKMFRGSNLKFPKIFYKAKKDVFASGTEKIPVEVLTGMLSSNLGGRHPQYQELWSSKEKIEQTRRLLNERTKATTETQKVRQQNSNERIGARVETNVRKVNDFMALYTSGYERGFSSELEDAINRLAEKKSLNLPYRNIGILVDDSESMSGHEKESKNHPRAIADFTGRVLRYSTEDFVFTKTERSGGTCLAEKFVDLVEQAEENGLDLDAIFILTDGYENSYDGLLGEVVEGWMKLTDNHNVKVFQISPVASHEKEAAMRTLTNSNSFIRIATRTPDAIETQIKANLLNSDIRAWLSEAIHKLLPEG